MAEVRRGREWELVTLKTAMRESQWQVQNRDECRSILFCGWQEYSPDSSRPQDCKKRIDVRTMILIGVRNCRPGIYWCRIQLSLYTIGYKIRMGTEAHWSKDDRRKILTEARVCFQALDSEDLDEAVTFKCSDVGLRMVRIGPKWQERHLEGSRNSQASGSQEQNPEGISWFWMGQETFLRNLLVLGGQEESVGLKVFGIKPRWQVQNLNERRNP